MQHLVMRAICSGREQTCFRVETHEFDGTRSHCNVSMRPLSRAVAPRFALIRAFRLAAFTASRAHGHHTNHKTPAPVPGARSRSSRPPAPSRWDLLPP